MRNRRTVYFADKTWYNKLCQYKGNVFNRKEASDVKSTAELVKEALDQAEKAQTAVTEALKQATSDIKGTQDLLVSVSLLLGKHSWRKYGL